MPTQESELEKISIDFGSYDDPSFTQEKDGGKLKKLPPHTDEILDEWFR
ncbi:hypothetical protein ACTRXD_00360 [Nitrospira sp. T9]